MQERAAAVYQRAYAASGSVHWSKIEMKRNIEANWKLAQLSRWENEGGSCPECEPTTTPPSRESPVTAARSSSDIAAPPNPYRAGPLEPPTGKPCF